ncbi:nucleotide exchange factor GrpE [Sphingomonas sp. 32-62-10]|uniref:nucleotide exchange factor GrpE n=1 Tax=Sphingomonas sp. 32-62-10 TaxID=1970436 RepID=UPI000BC678EB|nr:MAG: nucleotide exchange factor GrpE [Sphingomonas sp. 32-62-10]
MTEDENIESTEKVADEQDNTAPFELGEAELLAERVAVLEAELAEAKAAVLYAHAEAQNVRRRSEKEAIDARAYAVTAFARDILSVADNLSRGLSAMPEELRADGIQKIEALGETLDPNRHQAMMEMPSDAPPGTIVQEMQAGYMIRDRLLRPALVAVAKKPE